MIWHERVAQVAADAKVVREILPREVYADYRMILTATTQRSVTASAFVAINVPEPVWGGVPVWVEPDLDPGAWLATDAFVSDRSPEVTASGVVRVGRQLEMQTDAEVVETPPFLPSDQFPTAVIGRAFPVVGE